MWQFSPNTIHAQWPCVAPFQHSVFWLGTDELGRDVLSRLLVATALTAVIGLSTAVLAVFIGLSYGVVAGRRSSTAAMAALNIIYSLPTMMVVILLGLWADANHWPHSMVLVSAIAFMNWPDTARLVYERVQALAQEEFMSAQVVLGGNTWNWLWAYCLPNLWSTVYTSLLLSLPRAIMAESTLSFLGLGVRPPDSSLGAMIQNGWLLLRSAPHLLILPAFCLIVVLWLMVKIPCTKN